jgi:SulP family sulfate permease
MKFFKPKLIECLHGYSRQTFLSDLAAGVTVGIVALPLAIGFGIASGVTPAQGLWTAIIAGAIIAALAAAKCRSAARPAHLSPFSRASLPATAMPVSRWQR